MDVQKALDLITNKLYVWVSEFIKMLPNFLLAALLLVLGFFLASRIKKLSHRLFRKFSANATLINLMSSVVYVFFVGVTLFTVLSILQLEKAVTSILAGAGIVGLALAFAFQDIAANFISGVFILFRRPLHTGDIVKLQDYMGKVEEVNLRDTVLRTFQGQMVIIPNKEVFQNPIENYSLLGKRRMDLEIGVSYGEDLERVMQVTLQAVQDIEGLSPSDQTTMFYTGFGDSSINYILRLWVSSPEQPVYLSVGSQAIVAIKKAYDNHDITIPFPIRTLDFGIKGGTRLDEMNVYVNNSKTPTGN